MRALLIPVLCLAVSGVAMGKKPKTADEKPVTELTETARPSIVTITQIGRGGSHEALGTGFVISADGLIATNLHVIGNARRLQVQFVDGKLQDVTEIHATDPLLDLAIVRVGRKDLQPLPLGDSTQVKQGQSVVALGHPQGLEFSVVEGVVSAFREVEGTRMIQIAIPIEEGNSGGPLLDREGRVQGILTLKSLIKENLGFAHPINELKLLIDKPNPIPMERWLTVGRLDPKRWLTLMGGRWTQHVGIIHVEDSGDGFGGRALCLAPSEAPTLPFEATVTVKMDDESGAAGLVFCSDGHNQHYGFYPSGGKLRLTRFNGPDVFSWTILADVPSNAYRKGEWNTLRVHVDDKKIQCYVNDALVVEREDDVLRGGCAGLCKFRQTEANFKNFAVGASLGRQEISKELTESVKRELEGFLAKPAERDTTVEKLATEPVVARSVLEDRARSLEEQAASLRKLEKEVHRRSVTVELVKLLEQPAEKTDLLRAALLIAKHDNADLDVDAYVRLVERMADELRGDPAVKKDTDAAAHRLVTYLFEENGFHGSRGEDMKNLSNSYLNEVLDDREGVPITLSVVYLELARRLGIKDLHGVSLPGRFMVGFDRKVEGKKETTLIDLFSGGKFLKPLEAETLVMDSAGMALEDKYLEPATPKAIILRMLYNLASWKPEQSLGYLDLILAIEPTSARERFARAMMRARSGDIAGAKTDLEKILDEQPRELDMERVEALYHSL